MVERKKRMPVKLFGDNEVLEFVVTTVDSVGAITDTTISTNPPVALCVHVASSVCLFNVHTLDDLEVVASFILPSVVYFTPTKFGEVDAVTPKYGSVQEGPPSPFGESGIGQSGTDVSTW